MNADMFEHAPTDPGLAGIAAPDEHWPSTLADYMNVLCATFRRLGASDDTALDYAQQGVLALGQFCGGRQQYLPTGGRLRDAVRDRRLYLEANGRNKVELAQRYGITERRVEQITAEQKAIHVRKLQGQLFQD